jgi:hypothetical protein
VVSAADLRPHTHSQNVALILAIRTDESGKLSRYSSDLQSTFACSIPAREPLLYSLQRPNRLSGQTNPWHVCAVCLPGGKIPGQGAGYRPPSRAEVQNNGAATYFLPYVFMETCLNIEVQHSV